MGSTLEGQDLELRLAERGSQFLWGTRVRQGNGESSDLLTPGLKVSRENRSGKGGDHQKEQKGHRTWVLRSSSRHGQGCPVSAPAPPLEACRWGRVL